MVAMETRLRLLISAITLIAGSAVAETPNATPTPGQQMAPGGGPPAPAENLSDELNKSNGVINPKEVDPAIEKPAPRRETQMCCRHQGHRGALPHLIRNEPTETRTRSATT